MYSIEFKMCYIVGNGNREIITHPIFFFLISIFQQSKEYPLLKNYIKINKNKSFSGLFNYVACFLRFPQTSRIIETLV